MNKKEKTKKELLDELTALRQELENVQSTNAGLKKDKEALEEKGKFLSTIFSSIQEGISVLDTEMNIVFANPAMERWFSDKLPLVGQKCYQVYHNRDQFCEVCPCQETLQTGQAGNSVIPRLDAKGEILGWFHHFSFPVLDSETGRMSGVIEYIRNVTRRKQVEDALKASEERYRTIIETIADGYYEVDLAGNLTFFNKALAKTFSYPENELMGMNNRQYTDAENAKKMYQAFNRVYSTGEPAEGVRIETFTKNKTRRNLEISISLIRDTSGKPLGFRGIARDISDLIWIQNELQASEERYRTIIETIEDGYYEVDLKGKLTFFNDAMGRINGYSREEMMGMHGRDYTDAENAELLDREFSRVYRTRTPSKGILYEVITKNGERKNIETSVSLIRDHSGKPIGFRGIARDITDLIRTQEAFRASEERYRTIIETIEDAYYENDLAGTLTFFNDAMARVLGYTSSELKGMNNRAYTDTENAKIMYQAFNRVYHSGEPTRGIRYEVITKNGEKRNVETSISLIRDTSGNSVGFRGISRDITDLIQIQEALRKSEERYRTIIETIEDGYFEVDLKGNLTYFNDTMVRIHEYSREELLGMNNRQYTDAENAEILFKAFNQVYRTGESSKGTNYEIITKTGGRKNLESSVTLIRNLQGNPIGFRGIVRDVTELRQAQKALISSEERFRIAAESTNDFIYEWNLETGQVDWFGKAVDRLGDILGELPLTNAAFVKKINPEDLERITEAVRRHLRQGEPHMEEYRLIGKDGNIIYVKSAGMSLRNEEGRAYKWIGTLSDITERKKNEEELKQSFEKVRKAMGGIIQAMALTVESKDPYTAGHQQRVSSLARTIAQEMGLSKDRVEAIRLAGVVHDLGKISVPAEILSKPTKLSDLEFSLIKVHPQTSYDILKDIDFPWPIAEIALQHHERMNGSGYPAGLKGEEIMVEAQVLMVADVVEAIASHRPYRPAFGIDVALEEISKNKGKLYDPATVEACLRLFKEKGFSLG
ncbi:MAG: hypothetical protein A2Y79_09270 [Deltaproteobacteria bacterium RBG_13_43_22]|nr:MAG: hypothetical protein A2Y79_09270 [Deltaproteobacteria bacterium RBG_13_43_22]